MAPSSLLLLLLPLLLPLATAQPGQPPELIFGRSIHIPVLGDRNVTSYSLKLLPSTSPAPWLSVDLDFNQPSSAMPHLHFPRPVAVLHNASIPISPSDVPQLLNPLLFDQHVPKDISVLDRGAFEARLLQSGFVSVANAEQAVSVYNVAAITDRGPFPNGTLILTLLDGSDPPFCAGFFKNQSCSSNGECRGNAEAKRGRCNCETGFTASLCTEPVTNFIEGGSNGEFDADELEVAASPLEGQYVVAVQPFKTAYVAFNYSALSMQNNVRYEFSVRILKGASSTQDKQSAQYEIAASAEMEPNQLPNWDSDSKPFERTEDDRSLFEVNLSFPALGSRYIVALFANPSQDGGELGPAVFALTRPREPLSTAPVSRQRFLPQAMLPVCLSLIFIAALAVLLVFWLDRRSARSKMVDRLSEAELLRMYPAHVAERNEGECPICLTDMQVGDSLRVLRCEHHFHASCLDPWVCENRANCPTCRASVRVEHLSDNHRDPVCARNRSCWAFLCCRSRGSEAGEGEQEQQRTQLQENTQLSLEPQAENLRHGARIAFPDRMGWPLQMRTASSTPRTQSTTHAMSEGGSEGTSMHTALDLSFGSERREERVAAVSRRT